MFVNVKNDFTSSKTKTTALYGRVTWNLSPATSLLTGLRFNRDQTSYRIDTFDLGHQPVFSSTNSDSANSTVGDVTLRYKLDRDNMVYGMAARGYKPRAFNTAASLASNAALSPVEREDIDHFELGAKNTFGTVNTNLALFNTTYKNYQVQFYPPGQIIPALELANAGKARTRGIEFDASLALSKATKLSFSAAYIDAKFVDFKDAPAWPGQTPAEGAVIAGFDPQGAPVFKQDLSGKTIASAPVNCCPLRWPSTPTTHTAARR
jgi:iron complex outermembrane recepter protein